MAVAVNVTGVAVPAVAVSVLAPADVPSVQDVIVASPLASVMSSVAGLTVPLPDATAKRTGTPAVGLSNWSRTSTAGGVATAVPTVADCVLPAWIVSCVARSEERRVGKESGVRGPREAGRGMRQAVGPCGQAGSKAL